MSGELQQSVANATEGKLPAVIASALTACLGNSELIGTIVGALSAVPLGILSCFLVYGQIKKGKLERKIYHMQIENMEKEKEKDNDR